MTVLKVSTMVESDRSQICELARQTHEGTIFAEIPFSPVKFSASFDKIIKEPERYLGLKARLGERLLGFCYASLGGYYIGDGVRIVTVTVIATERTIRSTMLGGKAVLLLQRGIANWARSQEAKFILYHVTSGVNAANLDRFFRRSGFKTLGGNYGYAV